MQEAEQVQMIVPRGMLGRPSDETALEKVMRLAGKMLYAGDEEWWHSPEKYGADFDGSEIRMWPDYQDATCTCGFSEKADAWHAANSHAGTCYQKVRQAAIDEWEAKYKINEIWEQSSCDICEESVQPIVLGGVSFDCQMFTTSRSAEAEAAFEKWGHLHDEKLKFEDALSRRLCREMGIKWNKGWGSAVHCTCGVQALAKEWFDVNDHDKDCPVVRPQFLFRPTGLEVRWYKYIGREMETNRPVRHGELKQIREAINREALLVPAMREEWLRRKAQRKEAAATA